MHYALHYVLKCTQTALKLDSLQIIAALHLPLLGGFASDLLGGLLLGGGPLLGGGEIVFSCQVDNAVHHERSFT